MTLHLNAFEVLKPERLSITLRSVAGLVSLVISIGCGQSELAPVSGSVTVDGKPVAAAQVLFMAAGHRPAAGETDAQGHYVLSTYTSGDGAAIGTHKVTVTARPTIRVSAAGGSARPGSIRPNQIQHGEKSPVPAKYSNVASPLLTAEVKPGENTIPLELTGQ
jgi:hypothetical protein